MFKNTLIQKNALNLKKKLPNAVTCRLNPKKFPAFSLTLWTDTN